MKCSSSYINGKDNIHMILLMIITFITANIMFAGVLHFKLQVFSSHTEFFESKSLCLALFQMVGGKVGIKFYFLLGESIYIS